jgi:hypothetical protein
MGFNGFIPIINGAGGMITDYQGNDPVKGNSIVASNKVIHEEVIRILMNKNLPKKKTIVIVKIVDSGVKANFLFFRSEY